MDMTSMAIMRVGHKKGTFSSISGPFTPFPPKQVSDLLRILKAMLNAGIFRVDATRRWFYAGHQI
jgi:hypothetical protein